MTAHALLVAEAERLGWPEAYRDDLLIHDKAMLEDRQPTEFAWSIRRSGTHLIAPLYEIDCDWGLACSKNDGESAKYYLYQRGLLKPCTRFEWDCWIRERRRQMPEFRFTVEYSGQWIRPYRDLFTIKAATAELARETLDYRLRTGFQNHSPKIIGDAYRVEAAYVA